MAYNRNIILSAILISIIFIFGSKLFFWIKKAELTDAEAAKNLTADLRQKEINLLPAASPETSGEAIIPKTEEPINSVSTGQKIIALTFDADMTAGMEQTLKNKKSESWYNEAVIKNLEQTQTPATLFLTGLWIKNYPDTTKELAANPLFEIASHSYSHGAFAAPCFGLAAIPNESDEKEIIETEKLLAQYAPNFKKYFRFPGLCYDNYDISEARKLGYKIINGNIRGGDGFTSDANGIIARVISRLSPGGIIILHMHGAPNAPKTAEALPEIIRQAEEKGYRFVKISELLNSVN